MCKLGDRVPGDGVKTPKQVVSHMTNARVDPAGGIDEVGERAQDRKYFTAFVNSIDPEISFVVLANIFF